MKKISFIIPCYGSANTISLVIEEIQNVIHNNHIYDYEIITVNDKSPDNVWDVICNLAKKNSKIKAINLAKNMNRPGALMAGMSEVTGDYVVLMDDDGQCPMENLWLLVDKLEEGHDVAIAKYTEKHHSKFKNIGSFVNRKMTEYIIGKPKDLSFTNFAILKRFVIDEMKNYKNPYPYMTGLMLRTTSDIVNVNMEERARFSGNTNFTFKKMFNLWINGFTAFSIKPLRIATFLGGIVSIMGFIYLLFIIVNKVINPSISQGYSSLMAVLLFMGGMIMLILGMIGEYLGRIYISINNSPQYVIKDRLNCKDKKNEKN